MNVAGERIHVAQTRKFGARTYYILGVVVEKIAHERNTRVTTRRDGNGGAGCVLRETIQCPTSRKG